MGRKTSKKHAGVNVDHTVESVSGGNVDDNGRPRKDNKTTRVQQTSFVRSLEQNFTIFWKWEDLELLLLSLLQRKDSTTMNMSVVKPLLSLYVQGLRGHFGELSVHPFGSFTVENCFTASNLNLRETIVSEMLPLQAELSKTKQGPYLLRKLDIDGYARQPDQWKSRQASQQSALKEFYATFGPVETKSFEKDSFLADSVSKSKPGKLEDIRKEIKTSLCSAKTSNTLFLAHRVSKKVKRSKTEKKRHRKDSESESQRKKIKV
ncbi:putative pectinesterase 3-like [Capsicum annuum]|nr:putative pectinesterase 3-like [Capsicum annuum]